MSEKTPGGPLPKQTGTTQKTAPPPGKGAEPVKVNPEFQVSDKGMSGGKDGDGKK